MNSKLKALEKYLSASGSTARLVTFTAGPRLVVSSAANLRASVKRLHLQLSTGGAK